MAETAVTATTLAGTTTAPRFRIGYVLSQAFSILFRNIVPFGLLTILILLPQLILGLATGTIDPSADPAASFSFGFLDLIGLLLQFLLPYLLTAALVYGTVQHLRGHRVSVGDCLGRGLSLLLPVIGVVILTTIATVLGFFLLVIPGVIVMMMLWVAIPVAVIERPGVIASLKRSRELTSGHRWKIFAVVLILGIMGFVVTSLVMIPFGISVFSGAFDPSHDLQETLTTTMVINFVISAVFYAAYAVANAVGYYALRSSKEGVDIEKIAAVFD